jgi:Cd2+/Zn2+-exporting ATPase
MTVATVGAIAIGEFPEAAGVMLFYNLGEILQALSVNRSRRSIQALLEVRPDRARKMVNGTGQEVHPSEVLVGDVISVYPGERIPLDGEIIQGESLVDTSALTGEPVPVARRPGESVLAGTVNLEGLLTIRVSQPFSDSSIARIMDLVEQAGSRKAATEKFITRFARVYSPIVVTAALGVALVPPLLTGASISEWVYRAMVVLVISCPCALVVSIPLGYFGGVGGASRNGILVKGSNYLDALASVKTVIFDKTGTLTRGVFEVTQVQPSNGFSPAALLRYAAQAEAGSNHPIARSIRAAYGGETDFRVESAQEIPGHGVQTRVEGRWLLAGNDPLLHREQVAHNPDLCKTTGTVVHVAVDGTHAGSLVISDELKPDAVEAIQALRSVGVARILMLTGDNQAAGQEIASLLGVDDFQAEMLPEDKVAALDQVLATQSDGHKVAFVGDGINDAPALARADVSIAMGGLGSEAAIETADVVVMADSPLKVAQAIQIGKRTRRIVWQNIALALLIKAGFIALGIAGEASMWQAVFGDMGVALLAIFNASRVLGKKKV